MEDTIVNAESYNYTIQNPLITGQQASADNRGILLKKTHLNEQIDQIFEDRAAAIRSDDIDLENSELIFSQLDKLKNNHFFGIAQKSPGNEKTTLLLS